MMLIDNRNYLRIHNRTILEKLKELESQEDTTSLFVEESKKSIPTLKIYENGKFQYLHSKYDPESEAERLIAEIDSLEQYQHILFMGVGLGYHIKALLKRFPDMNYSIFEPNMNVLKEFLSYQNLDESPFNRLKHIISATEELEIKEEITKLYQSVGNKIYILKMPIYDRIYNSVLRIGFECLKGLLKDKSSNIVTNAVFQKRWTINSIKNFPALLQTPNVLHDIDRNNFEGKPAIIVAAGPSLSEEFENLRYIKEHGLAYIFSVGSAINALIENNIYPDAACTYDPTEKNQIVIKKVKDKGISNIPLIFGSSVGFETLENYPGPMLHMITSQDTVAPHLLNTDLNIDIVLDGPSIAVVTFQMLSILGFDKIILVGQNLAYLNNERYSKGIEYEHVSNILSENEIKESIVINDVYGNNVYTTDSFNRMRQQLEMYIRSSSNISVFNTTRGGAHIEGSKFKPLSEVIKDELNSSHLVRENWYNSENSYEREYTQKQIYLIEENRIKYVLKLSNLEKELAKIELTTRKQRLDQLEKLFAKFDKKFSELKINPFYHGFIEPMLRVQNQYLSDEIKTLRYEKNLGKKAEKVIELFGHFLAECYAHYDLVMPYFNELKEKIKHATEFSIRKM